jgi:uncharacterized pyridoxal phosphate-containing UPF0001 family protein
LQRNKAVAAARWADRVESVDSTRVADALDRAVRRLLETGGRAAPLPVLLQFSVDGDPAGVACPTPTSSRSRSTSPGALDCSCGAL